jgi:hypothetical protein
MVKHLWPNFLTDAGAYDAALQFWDQLWHEKIDPWGVRAHWAPWINTHFANGTPFRDGNPIFGRLSLRDRRAVRVIQSEPTSANPIIDFWLQLFPADAGTAAGVTELVVVCELSEESAQLAAGLIASWVNRGTLKSEAAEIAYANAGVEEWESAPEYQLVG